MSGAEGTLKLTAPRLTLRQLAQRDACDLRRIVTIPQVGRMLFAFPPDWSEQAARAFIDTWQFRGPLCGRLAICDAQDRFIGSVGAFQRDERVEVFYFLDPATAGQGYATEAMTAFIAWLFAQFSPVWLYADAFTDNPASSRVLEKLGFEKTGVGMGTSAARLEPFPVSLYRLSQSQFKATL